MWGQGIPDGSKYRDNVTTWLQTQLQGTHVPISQFVTRAHSGAQVYVDPGSDAANTWYGEIPRPQPSIALQISLTLQDLQLTGIPSSQVRLVLIDGCINDVGLLSILDPVNSTGAIRQWTDQWCLNQMMTVVSNVLQTFPQAAVVLTGYYQIVTPQSDMGSVVALMTALGWSAGPWGALGGVVGGVVGMDQVVANCGAFADEAHSDLAQVVAQANQMFPGPLPRVALAWPQFDDSNGYAAPNRFLFLAAEFAGDEAAGFAAAQTAGTATPRQPVTTPNDVAFNRGLACAQLGFAVAPYCADASMGHPNLAGETAYTSAVIGALQTQLAATIGLPPPPPPPPYLRLTVQSGKDSLGPTIKITPGGTPTKLTNWVNVTAFNSQSGAPVSGAVAIRSTSPRPQSPVEGVGRTAQKLYYACTPEFDTHVINGRAVVTSYPCALSVSAPGWPTATASIPSS